MAKQCCNCDNRSITFQIAMGVVGTLSIIFVLLVIVISLNVYFLNRETETRIENQLQSIYCKNLSDLGKEGSASIDVIRAITSRLLDKVEIMTTDVLDPGQRWPNGQYPLITSGISTAGRSGTDANCCDSALITINGLQANFNPSSNPYKEIIEKIVVLETVWLNSLNLKMGPERKIELSYMFFYFEQSSAQGGQKMLLVQGQVGQLNSTRFNALITTFQSNISKYNSQSGQPHLFLPMIQDPFTHTSLNQEDRVISMMKQVAVPAPYTSNFDKIYIGVMFKQTAFNYMIKILEGDEPTTSSSRQLEIILVEAQQSGPTISALLDNNSLPIFQDTGRLFKSITEVPGFETLWSTVFTGDGKAKNIDNQDNCKISGAMVEVAGNDYYVSVRATPYNTQGEIDGYLVLLQNKQELEGEIGGLSDKIRSDTIILTVCVLVVCLLVLTVIGAVVICYSKQISTPIQNLNKVVENIKKQSNKDDFYKTLENQQIFKRIEENKHPDAKKNYDEIDRLIHIFYQFFVGEKKNQTDKKEPEGDRLFVTKYKYYPNLYYNKDSDGEQEDEPQVIQEEEKEEDGPEDHLLRIPRGGEIELQGLNREKDDETEKEFDYAANIEKTKKLIKKLTKSHRPIRIDWNDLLERVKDVDNATNRVVKDA